MDKVYRYTDNPIEIVSERSETGNTTVFRGYAAVYYDGTPATEFVLVDRKGYRQVERIAPGAFKRSLTTNKEIDALYEHRPDWCLDTTSSNLKLSEDKRGLKFEFPYDNEDSQHQTVLAKAKKNMINGASFGFNLARSQKVWSVDPDGTRVCTLTDIEFDEVTLTRRPCYKGTTAGASRSEIDSPVYDEKGLLDLEIEIRQKKLKTLNK